jgi:hypothetical protein
MHPINKIFTLYSLAVLIIIIERLLPYTRNVLQPYNFISVHQLIQTLIFIPITVILLFFAMKIITNNFHALKEKGNSLLVFLFVIGVYFYGAGEGWHEVANFALHTHCNTHQSFNNICGGLFINSFYTGNLIFFIGGVFMNLSLLTLAKKLPTPSLTKNQIIILILNSIVYAFTWFAYAAFDTVSVGFLFSLLLTITSLGFLTVVRKKWKAYPFIIYSAIAYSLATIATCIVRFS